MNPKLILGLALVLSALLTGCATQRKFGGSTANHKGEGEKASDANFLKMSVAGSGKTIEQVESVQLPSGEILENHTYFDGSGMDGQRFNKVFLKNPTKGTSELVGNLNDETNPDHSSLLKRFPHPQEMVRGDEKVLVIGPYVCKRWEIPEYGRPYWYIFSFDMAAGDAAAYLQSFSKAANPALATLPGEGPAGHLHYQFDDLDLENNILTVKRVPWNAQVDFPEYRAGFPDYLVYSANGYNGRSGYVFPWKFDVIRTRAKHGPQWEKPMPFRMALDYSVITFPIKSGAMPNRETYQSALAHAGMKEVGSATLELSDQALRTVECRYALSGTNQMVEKVEARYGFAGAQTNRFNLVWQPQNPAAWHVPGLTLNE
mgnify:CR=1 FL=1